MNDKPMAARIIEYLIAGDSHLLNIFNNGLKHGALNSELNSPTLIAASLSRTKSKFPTVSTGDTRTAPPEQHYSEGVAQRVGR